MPYHHFFKSHLTMNLVFYEVPYTLDEFLICSLLEDFCISCLLRYTTALSFLFGYFLSTLLPHLVNYPCMQNQFYYPAGWPLIFDSGKNYRLPSLHQSTSAPTMQCISLRMHFFVEHPLTGARSPRSQIFLLKYNP